MRINQTEYCSGAFESEAAHTPPRSAEEQPPCHGCSQLIRCDSDGYEHSGNRRRVRATPASDEKWFPRYTPGNAS